MSHFGYGTGGYLTRFEDYYKSSSDESEDEEESPITRNVPPTQIVPEVGHTETVFNPEEFYDSEDEEDNFGEEFVTDDLQEGTYQVIEAEEIVAPSKDWVPMDLNDLKMTIKPPKNFKGYQEGAYPQDVDEQHEVEEDEGEDKVFSNDYADVCKFKCNLCGLDIDTEKIRSHINSNHESSEVVDNELDSNRPYSVKTYHKCGVCGKSLLFTRVRLRYHIINDHNMSVQDYNDQFMAKKGGRQLRQRRGSGNDGDEFVYDGGEADVDPSTVLAEEISNDYADIVKIECKICNKHIEKDNFRFLHLKKHGMDMADYRLVYGEPTQVKNSYHRCFICQTIFVFTRSRLAGHLARHKISVRDYGNRYLTKVKVDRNLATNLHIGEIDKDCLFSNDYEDECQTICKICERSLNYGNLGSHLYQSHSSRMKDYVENYGDPEITKKSYHECAICHETLLFIRYQLLTHVKTKHNMTITAYNKAHMQLHNVEYGESNILDKGRKIGTQKAPQWCDGTMYKCPYCFNIYYRYFTFRIHLINSHKMTDTEERSICVRENEILTDIYRCKICSTQVKRDRMDIEAHLKQAHKTTLKIYSANFENPAIKESAKEVVDKLVRMGVLEEPSKSVCRTPKKLKPRPPETKSDNSNDVPEANSATENLNKFVSMSENVIANEKSPEQGLTFVNVKTEVQDSSYMSTSMSVSPNQELDNQELSRKRKRKLPAKFSSDFELESVTKSLTTPDRRTASSKASSTVTSSSVSTQRNVNSSPAVRKPSLSNGHAIKTEIDAARSSGDEGVVYRCPLTPCSWTCGKDGMRTGPAVLHLLKVHKIQPLEMRERGIKFDKIQV